MLGLCDCVHMSMIARVFAWQDELDLAWQIATVPLDSDVSDAARWSALCNGMVAVLYEAIIGGVWYR